MSIKQKTIHPPEYIIRKVEELAKKEKRNFSNMCVKLMSEAIAQREFDK